MQVHSNRSQRQFTWVRPVVLVLCLSIVVVILLSKTFGVGALSAPTWWFQSNLPEREERMPHSWIKANEGGEIFFGAIHAILPLYFTDQGGANVFGDIVQNSGIEKPLVLIPGTEFAFGIWPGEEQTEYQEPIEFRITLDAAHFQTSSPTDLQFMMYDPAAETWRVVESEFKPETYQTVAYVQSFTPVPDDFLSWGGRTFFGLFRAGQANAEPTAQNSGSQLGLPTVNRTSNIRSGPGIRYPVVDVVRSGRRVTPIAQTEDGRWLQLDDDTWIAAFLVDNTDTLPVATNVSVPPTPTPTPTATPRATAERATATASNAADSPPTIRAIGVVEATSGTFIDLDESNSNSDDGVDLLFRPEQSSGDQILAPVNGAKIGAVSEQSVNYDMCNAAEYSEKLIRHPNLDGRYLCVLTDQQGVSVVQFYVVTDNDNGDVTQINFVTWRHTP